MSYARSIVSAAWSGGNLILSTSDGGSITPTGTPPVSSSAAGVLTKSASYTLLSTDLAGLTELTIYVNASTGNAVVTVDPALLFNSTAKTSVKVNVKRDPIDTSTNSITVTPKTGTTLETGAAGAGMAVPSSYSYQVAAKDASTLALI